MQVRTTIQRQSDLYNTTRFNCESEHAISSLLVFCVFSMFLGCVCVIVIALELVLVFRRNSLNDMCGNYTMYIIPQNRA